MQHVPQHVLCDEEALQVGSKFPQCQPIIGVDCGYLVGIEGETQSTNGLKVPTTRRHFEYRIRERNIHRSSSAASETSERRDPCSRDVEGTNEQTPH